MDLEKAVGIVTGGASGLGRATVEMLIQSGGTAVVFDLDGPRLRDLGDEFGDAVLPLAVDVTDSPSVQAGVDEVVTRYGHLDLCVNCAGRADAARTYKDGSMFPLQVYREVIDLNLVALFDVCRNAARAMSANTPNETGERGVIVNVASIAGFEGQSGQAAYAASKAGVIGLTLPLARDLASLGIRVCTIAPGVFRTEMNASTPPRVRERLERVAVFPKGVGDPSHFASLVAEIIANSALNGEVIRLDAAARLGHRS